MTSSSSVFSTGGELDEIIIPSACLASDKARIEKGSEESKGAGGEDGRGKSANRALPCTICGKAQWRYSCMGCCYSDLYKYDPEYSSTLSRYTKDLPLILHSIQDRMETQSKVNSRGRVSALVARRAHLARETAFLKRRIENLRERFLTTEAAKTDASNGADALLWRETLHACSNTLHDEIASESDVRKDIAAFINESDAATHGDSPPYEASLGTLNTFHSYHRLRANIHALTSHRTALCHQLRDIYPILWRDGHTPEPWSPLLTSRSGEHAMDGTDNKLTPSDSLGSLSASRMLTSRSRMTSSQTSSATSADLGNLRSVQGAITKYSQLVPALNCIAQILQVHLPFPCQFGLVGSTARVEGRSERPTRRQLPLEPRVLHPALDLLLPLVPPSSAGLSTSPYVRHSSLDPHRMLREDIRFLSLICGVGIWFEGGSVDDLTAAQNLINSPDVGRLYTRALLDRSIALSGSGGGGWGDTSLEHFGNDDAADQQQQQLLPSPGMIDEIEWNILD
ncbi:hypothetical protein FOZ60_011749 [Perkinsus olseni]|uniref:Uncharacterized protein n=1 Tax=Perkinsus olseni TaxID=32597 RepID=A0A7J6PLQ2_PEROL|nr:hypothetical protein FOZ60_011749 [Perkinsus olseni]